MSIGTRLVGVGVAAILSGHVSAQEGLVTQRVLSLAMAKTIAEATLAECKAKGFHTAAAVVDRVPTQGLPVRITSTTRMFIGSTSTT